MPIHIVKECIQEAIDENFKLIMIRPDHVALAKQMIVKSNSGLQISLWLIFQRVNLVFKIN
jgi:deoxyribose-phosphate aldolase